MARVQLYTIEVCPYCDLAKQLLQRKGIPFEEHDLSLLSDQALHEKMTSLSGQRTVPQIVIDGRSIGGFTDLRRLDDSGDLDRMLAA